MARYFSSSKSLIGRADAHLRELDHKSSQFFNKKPFETFAERAPETGGQFLKARLLREMPDEFACITFDTVNALRSALDHAVYDSAVILTGQEDPAKTKFPFGDTHASAKAEFNGNASGVPASIRDFLLDFKPYKEAGDQLLWALNRIRNVKIHRALIPTAVNSGGFGIGNGYIEHLETMNEWDATKQELTYAFLKGKNNNFQYGITLNMTFGKETLLEGRPVNETLKLLSRKIAGIVESIEGETTRLRGGP
jgi:hypothetical protein